MRGRVLHHAIAAKPDDQSDAHRADEVDQREEDGVEKDRVDICFAVILVDCLEATQRFRLRIKDLHGLRAGKVLLQKSVDARDACSDHVIAASRALAKPRGGGPEHRDRQQCNQRELHIHP